jgi:hypothetical protein
MIGDGKIYFQDAGQGTEKPFRLTKRKVKDHTSCQSYINRGISIGSLPAGFSRWAAPSRS